MYFIVQKVILRPAKLFVFFFLTDGQVVAFTNPLSPSIKLQILLLCFHTFLREVVGRGCESINRI